MPASHSRQNQDSRKDQRIQHRSRQSPHRCISAHQQTSHQRSHHAQSGRHRKHHAFRQNTFHQKQRHQENPYQIDPQRSHASLQKDHPHCLSFSFFLAHKKPPLKHAHTRAYSKGGPFYDEIRSDHFSSVSAASSTTGASSTAGASSATGSAPFLPFFAGAAVAAASC